MAATRDRINRIKIEKFRISQVPIDPAAVIFQGDQMVWNPSTFQAEKAVTGPSASRFLGISETTNPIETVGSTRFLSDSEQPRINIVQHGMVEQIVDVADAGQTYRPYATVVTGSDPQTVKLGSTAAEIIGFVDPGWARTGKVVAAGDLVKIWLRPTNIYDPYGGT